MRFNAEHRFYGAPGAVAAVLSDPDFYIGLDLPDLGRPALLDHRMDERRSVVLLRYEFVGRLDPVGRRLLGNHKLVWVQEIAVDQSTESGELSFRAEADPKRLHGTAQFSLVGQGGVTVRRLSGELVVSVPLVGPPAERRIVPGLLRRLGIEAEAVNKHLVA